MSERSVGPYAMRDPHGALHVDTVRFSKSDVWGVAYPRVAAKLGAVWTSRYWKRWDAALKSADRRGWDIVPVSIEERQ